MRAPYELGREFVEWLESVCAGEASLTDETYVGYYGEELQVDRMLGKLWNCTDIVGHQVWTTIEMPPNSIRSVAAMARHIKALRRNAQ